MSNGTEVYRCLTHNLTMTITGNKRIITGAIYGQTPQCWIALMPKVPVTGEFGNCKIVSYPIAKARGLQLEAASGPADGDPSASASR